MGEAIYRSGFGYDLHRLEEGAELILGGVKIPTDGFGTVAHSDGDVLAHAVCDALLGGAALGDIGQHFPDTAAEFAGADSMKLLRRVRDLLDESGFSVVNIDATVVLERPKLAPFRRSIEENLRRCLDLPDGRVSVKATTNEKVGPVGEGNAVAVYAIAMLRS